MKTEIKTTGFKEFDKVLAQFPPMVQNRIAQGVASTGGRVIRREIKKSAPVDADERSPLSLKFGRLKDNIRLYPMKGVKFRGQKGARIDTGKAPWGYWLEKGTRYIAARPWFVPAFDRASQTAIQAMRDYFLPRMEKEMQNLLRKNRL